MSWPTKWIVGIVTIPLVIIVFGLVLVVVSIEAVGEWIDEAWRRS